MALRKGEKQEDVGVQRRTSATARDEKKKKKKLPVDDVPVSEKAAAAGRKPKPSRKLLGKQPNSADGDEKEKKKGSGSLLDQVSAIMGKTKKSNKAKTAPAPTPTPTPTPAVAKATRQSIRQTDEGDDQPLPSRKKAAAKKPVQRNNIPPPPPPPAESPPVAKSSKKKHSNNDTESTLEFLKRLEEERKEEVHEEEEEEEEEEEATTTTTTKKKKKKKKLKKKLSTSQQQNIQREIAKRRQLKAKRREVDALHVEDDQIEQVGWFTMTVKENSSANLDYNHEEENKTTKKKKKKTKKPKELRSTVDYSREYRFTTRQEMEDKPAGYYQHMVGVKRRNFHIDNLFTARPLVPRVYHFDVDIVNKILDRREDKWWIRSRLATYLEDEDDEDSEDEEEKGMEALSIYFGPNEIDNDPDNEDDNSVIFSIASVESVHFSDDDDNQDTYKGKLRDKVEVMPGEFKMIRKEEETYEAIENGTYMSSLCLGCGVALVSVQDAREVACPTCGSITPLNGVCLHKPFGIATGIKRIKVEHMLAPKKSPFDTTSSSVPKTVNTTKQPAPAAAAAAKKEPPRKPLKEMKVSELRALCKERGIDTAGMLEKKEMVDALQKSSPAPPMDRREKEQRKMKSAGLAPKAAGAAKANANSSGAKTANPNGGGVAKSKTGSSGLRVRPSTTNKAASTRGLEPTGKTSAANTKVRPTKPGSKPGAVRVAAR